MRLAGRSIRELKSMNRRPLPRTVCIVGFAAGLLTAGGCVDVKGAAAELSWSIRTFSGQPVQQCQDSRIDRIKLEWRSDDAGTGTDPDQVLVSEGSEEFECEANRGVTDFEITPGRQLLWITPICDSQDEPAPETYRVPPPIARDVRNGEVVTLNSLLIVVQTTDCGSPPCTCL